MKKNQYLIEALLHVMVTSMMQYAINNDTLPWLNRCPVLFKHNNSKTNQKQLPDGHKLETNYLAQLAAESFSLPISTTPINLDSTNTHNDTLLHQQTCYTNITLSFKYHTSTPHLVVLENNKRSVIFISQSFNPYKLAIYQLALTHYLRAVFNITIDSYWIYTINPTYSNKNTPETLFKKHLMTRRVLKLTKKIKDFFNLLSSIESIKPILGKHCVKPDPCEHIYTCWPNYDRWDIFKLIQMPFPEKLAYHQQNIHSFKDIKNKNIVNLPAQRNQIDAELHQKLYYNPHIVKSKLMPLTSTFQTLDFEAVSLTAPLFDDQHPFEPTPFLFSIHTHNMQSNITTHNDRCFFEKNDFRRQFALDLIELLAPDQSIVLYDAMLEKKVLKKLITLFPDLKTDLLNITSHIIDIAPLFNDHHVILPGMNGKSSLKQVIQCIPTTLDFSDLTIQSGHAAVDAYKQLIYSTDATTVDNERNVLSDLKKYCKLDTQAILEIVLFLKHTIINT